MPDKSYHEMTNSELLEQHGIWAKHVADAAGWASAYFAAKQLGAVVSIGNHRGMGLTNPYPIIIGDAQ